MTIDPRNVEVMDDAMAEVYRQKTFAERLHIANQMWLFAQKLYRSQIRAAHPDWDDAQVARETARRISNGSVTGTEISDRCP